MNLLPIVRRCVWGRAARNALGLAGVLVLLGGNAGAGCSTTAPVTSIDVPLDYRPKSVGSTPVIRVPAGDAAKVYVAPTADKRTDARTLGQNTEDSTPIPVFAASRTPADFVTDVLRQELRSAGLNVAGEASGSQRQVDSEVLQFRVDESNTYKSEVRLAVKVLDPAGQVLWQGVGVGTAGNYGKSKSVVNYQETFSTALQQAIGKILADPAFTQAVSDGAAK